MHCLYIIYFFKKKLATSPQKIECTTFSAQCWLGLQMLSKTSLVLWTYTAWLIGTKVTHQKGQRKFIGKIKGIKSSEQALLPRGRSVCIFYKGRSRKRWCQRLFLLISCTSGYTEVSQDQNANGKSQIQGQLQSIWGISSPNMIWWMQFLISFLMRRIILWLWEWDKLWIKDGRGEGRVKNHAIRGVTPWKEASKSLLKLSLSPVSPATATPPLRCFLSLPTGLLCWTSS